MKGNRMDRLNGEIQKAVYDITVNKIKNPMITEMISITKVDCAPDLSHAKIYVSVFSADKTKAENTFKGILESAGKIRYELAHKLTVRTVPELHFLKDESMEYSDKINKILNGLDIKPEDGESE